MKTQSIREFIAQYGDINLLEGNKYNGSLDLRGTQITALPEGLTVGGSLDLRGTQITALPEDLTVGGSLDLRGTQITALPKGLTVGGYLDLRGTQITALPEGLTVGGYLDLGGTQITALPKGLTVGGYLDLQGTQITALPEDLTVGGYLDLRNGKKVWRRDDTTGKLPNHYHWQYHNREYIKADGIFQRVIKRKGNVFQVQNIGAKDVAYLVTDGNDIWAHGSTLHEAHNALQAKMLQSKPIEERIADFKAEFECGKKYPASEFFKWHYILTGSCNFGRREFCRQHNIDLDNDTYTVEEFIELTKNAYGGEVIRQI